MRRAMITLAFLLVVLAAFAGNVSRTQGYDIIQGRIVGKWELGKWQIDDEWTVFEGYSRLEILVEYPVHLRGRIFTLYYDKWNVPRDILPKKKGLRWKLAIPAGSAPSGVILWPMVKKIWLVGDTLPAQPVLSGKPGFSM